MAQHHLSSDIFLADIARIGGFTMRGAANEDFAGFNFGWTDINGDGLSDLIVCADGYDGGGLLAGGAFVIYGQRDGVTPLIDFANLSRTDGFVIQGEFAYDLASRSIAGAGDVNGDGIADMLIGAFKNDAGGHDSGAAYIIYGRTTLFESVIDLYDLPGEVGIKVVGEAAEDYAGLWVASAGDVNGDGRNDLIVGAPQNDAGGSDSGAAYVIFGRDSDFPSTIALLGLDPSVGFKISGASGLDVTGLGVSGAGDINGDGLDDLIIGAPQDGTAGSGLAYVIYGRSDIGAIDLAQLTGAQGFVIRGETAGDQAGFNVDGAGDVNGDGLDDLLIGATQQDAGGRDAGAAYVIFGTSTGSLGTFDLASLDGTNGFKLVGAGAGGTAGVCVSTAGDVNGDGYDDILVGAEYAMIGDAVSGAAYLLFGRTGGFAPAIDLGRLDPRDGIRILGESAGDTTGRALSAAGDMNGDGYDDIVVGSPGNSAAASRAGSAYVIYGRPDNHAPVAVDTRISAVEDVVHTFRAADFGFLDVDGDTLAEIRITTLASRGVLMLLGANGARDAAVTVDQRVSVADIDAGRLVFLAEADASGTAYAGFTFRVRDDGGTVAAGEDTSAGTATLTIDVAADSTDAQDVIYGTDGDDDLVANGPAVRLIGLDGNDTYTVGSQAHQVIEAVGGGDDTIRTSGDYVLAGGSEIEVLAASDPASTAVLALWGNEFDNLIRGNAGTNSILGGGGSNILEGLGGDDSYVVESMADQVIEVSGGGYDSVYALGDYILTTDAAVEVLLAYDRANTFTQNLTGNASDNLIIGSNGNNVLVGGGGRDTLYGLGGNDTFFVDSADDRPVELAGEGFDTIVTSVGFVIPQGMEFEVLRASDPTATAAIDLTGNKIPNIIIGNAGNNLIDGLGGGDDMRGLGGDDTYIVRKATDRVQDAIGGGTDTIRTLVSYALAADADIERLEADDPLDTAALHLTGNALANVLVGNAGNNLIDGLGGGDDMRGLGGDDTYIVRKATDRVGEAIGGGIDTVRTLVSYALAADAEIERLEAYDPLDMAALNLTGNAQANVLFGNAGANSLRSGGGADLMSGGGGGDSYLVENAGAEVIELAGGGTDTVYTIVSFALGTGSAVETLTVYERATTGAIDLAGNELAQRIIGNDGVNVLRSGGGADLLYGLGGNDTYLVESADARVFEFAGGGSDTVDTTVSYTLGNDAAVEVLTAYDRSGNAALSLGGNAFAQTVYGTAGVNFLNGGGGADILYGLGGNDAYLVDGLDDQVFEFAGGGTDTVYATGSFALGHEAEVETLTVYDRDTTNALNLTGGDTAQRIIGNNGTNVLDGKGGADTLVGLGGADTFAFSTALGGGNVDEIVGFAPGSDDIQLSSAIFAGLTLGALAAGAFVNGSVAADADDRIVYNQTTGQLFYDADGNGVGAAVLFATLGGGTALVAWDFVVI